MVFDTGSEGEQCDDVTFSDTGNSLTEPDSTEFDGVEGCNDVASSGAGETLTLFLR